MVHGGSRSIHSGGRGAAVGQIGAPINGTILHEGRERLRRSEVITIADTGEPGFIDAVPASMSAEGDIAGAGHVLRKGIATLTAECILAGKGTRLVKGIGELSAASNLVGTGTRRVRGAADMSATSNLDGSGVRFARGLAALSAQSDLAGAGRTFLKGAGALSGESGLSGAGRVLRQAAQGDMSASSELTVAASLLYNGRAVLSAQSDITGAGEIKDQYVDAASASLAALSDLSGAGRVFRLGFADLSGVSSFTGRGTLIIRSRPADLSVESQIIVVGGLVVAVPPREIQEDVALWPCPVSCGGWMHAVVGQFITTDAVGHKTHQGPFVTKCDNCGFEMEQMLHSPVLQ
jgi:hypothetical protein